MPSYKGASQYQLLGSTVDMTYGACPLNACTIIIFVLCCIVTVKFLVRFWDHSWINTVTWHILTTWLITIRSRPYKGLAAPWFAGKPILIFVAPKIWGFQWLWWKWSHVSSKTLSISEFHHDFQILKRRVVLLLSANALSRTKHTEVPQQFVSTRQCDVLAVSVEHNWKLLPCRTQVQSKSSNQRYLPLFGAKLQWLSNTDIVMVWRNRSSL